MSYNHYRKIWNLGWPLIISGFGQTLINITDTIFLGRLSEAALGASAISGLFFYSIAMISFGLGSGTQIIIARYKGAGQDEQAIKVFQQAYIMQVGLAMGLFFILIFSHTFLLKILISNSQVYEAGLEFLRYRLAGIFPLFVLTAFRAYYAGIGSTGIIGFTTVLLAILNLVLNYLFVFGWSFIPSMGIKGSALASVIAELVSALFIVVFFIVSQKNFPFTLLLFPKTNPGLIKEIISLSYPIVLQFLISLISWLLFFVIVERTGPTRLAISNVIRNVYSVIMTPIIAFSHVMSTVVSYHVGMKDYRNLKSLISKVLTFSLLITLGIIVLALISPSFIMQIFTNQIYLIEQGYDTYYLVLFALILFAISVPQLNALSAMGKTQISFMIEFVTMFLYVGFCYVFALILHGSLPVIWSVEIIYFVAVGISASRYIYKFINQKLNEGF